MNAFRARIATASLLFSCCLATAQFQVSVPVAGAAVKRPDPVSVLFARVDSAGSRTLSIEMRLSMASDVHIYADDSMSFAVTQAESLGLGPARLNLPATQKYANFDGATVNIYRNGPVIRLSRPMLSDTWDLQGALRYQACNDKMCFMPVSKRFRFSSRGHSGAVADSVAPAVPVLSGDWRGLAGRFTVAGSVGGYLAVDRFAAFLDNPAGSGGQGAGAFAGKSLWLVMALIVLGGLLLNLTPCVLPMLPITIAVLGAGANARSKAHGFLVGGVYGLAMALSYGAAGLAVVLTGSTFGALNSSWTFNIAIALVFVLMALAMFDIIHVDFTRFRGGGVAAPASNGGRLLTVLAMGVLAALLAGACVAPVVISVILYATTLYAKGHVAGLLLPFLLGVGMALPWPFAGAGLSFLPRPGVWMTWVRNGFGAIIMVIAVYYGYVGVKLLQEGRQAQVAAAAMQAEPSGLAWNTSLAEGLTLAEVEGKPVLVDFWATWCKNCHAMDATTMRDAKVKEKLGRFVLVKYQAEKPGEEPAKSVLEYFRVVGLPTYVVLSVGK